jgi:hypothetical protein
MLPVSLDEALEKFRAAANAMARGDPRGVKAMYSERPDVTLANPFGHAVCGRAAVDAALDYVSSRTADLQAPLRAVMSQAAESNSTPSGVACASIVARSFASASARVVSSRS